MKTKLEVAEARAAAWAAETAAEAAAEAWADWKAAAANAPLAVDPNEEGGK